MTTYLNTAECAPRVHTYYATCEDAEAIARAKSRDGQFYVPVKCAACSGWRLRRVS